VGPRVMMIPDQIRRIASAISDKVEFRSSRSGIEVQMRKTNTGGTTGCPVKEGK